MKSADEALSVAKPTHNFVIHERRILNRFIDRCHATKDWPELTKIVREELRQILPHEFFACAILRTHDHRIRHLFNLDFPSIFLKALVPNGSGASNLLAQEWCRMRKPILLSGEEIQMIFEHPDTTEDRVLQNLSSLAIHGLGDPSGSTISFFYFAQIPHRLFNYSSRILHLLTPHLYAALVNIAGLPVPQTTGLLLTPREFEVLKWLHRGKTNDEIGLILGISEYTVKNHIQKILLKLNVSNRTQAVVRAIEHGIVRG